MDEQTIWTKAHVKAILDHVALSIGLNADTIQHEAERRGMDAGVFIVHMLEDVLGVYVEMSDAEVAESADIGSE